MIRSFITVVACSLAAGCTARSTAESARMASADSARTDSIARARQDSINRTLPGYVVDSILPVDEEIRRFRAAIGGPAVSRLEGGSGSRDDLVQRFMRSAQDADTAAMRRMALSAREFADLYYLSSPYARSPYRQSPALAWKLIQSRSDAGMMAVVRRYAGRAPTVVAVRCDPKPTREGRNVIHSGCLVDLKEGTTPPLARLLFGSIIERDGQFKFVSFTNKF